MSPRFPLATIFAANREDAAIGEGLEGSLAGALERARAAWPDLGVDDAAYVRYLAGRAPPGARLDALFGEDLYLACACAAGDARAVEVFDRRYLGELARTLTRSGIPDAVADEVVQVLRARLFVAAGEDRAKILEYTGRGPIGGWLRVAGIRLASKHRRAEATRAAVAHDAGPAAGLSVADPELATLQRRYGEASSTALREAFASLTVEERSVLRLHFVDGLNLERIGVALGLSRATVGRRMIAARERLLDETLRRLGDRIQATPSEVRSLLGVLRSKIEVSLGALLDEPRA